MRGNLRVSGGLRESLRALELWEARRAARRQREVQPTSGALDIRLSLLNLVDGTTQCSEGFSKLPITLIPCGNCPILTHRHTVHLRRSVGGPCHS